MTEPSSSVSFPALGTTAVVVVTDPVRLEPARGAVEEVIEAFDLACSRFRDDSEVRALGAASGGPVRVTPLLCEAIAAALRGARLTDGEVDPTVGKALIALGYDRDFEYQLEIAVTLLGLALVVWLAVKRRWAEFAYVLISVGTLATSHVYLSVPREMLTWWPLWAALGVWCVRRPWIKTVYLAVAGPVPPEGWRVRVTDDHRAGLDAPGQWIALRSGGLATSSTTARRWETGSGQAHHLVDPASGRPVDSCWRTVSVNAASCLDANIASTASIVRGERAFDWLESLGLPSRLVGVDGSVSHVAGWPAQWDDLA